MHNRPFVEITLNRSNDDVTADDLKSVEDAYHRIKALRRVIWLRANVEGKSCRWIARAVGLSDRYISREVNKVRP